MPSKINFYLKSFYICLLVSLSVLFAVTAFEFSVA